MIKKIPLTYPCYTGEEERTAYIYLPVGYNRNRRRRYPVLYMFDGHNLFFDSDATYGKSWGLGGYLDSIKCQIIVAALDCNHNPENGRLSEYSPFDFSELEDFGAVTGRGEETMQWYTQVFKPFVDEHFRTLRSRKHTFISGSSMGGLMTIYALMAYNDVFSRGAALSPTMDADVEALSEIIKGNEIREDTVLYMDYGEGEFAREAGSRENFQRLSYELVDKGVLLTARVVPKGEHNEATWEKDMPFVMSTLLYRG